MAIVLKWPWMGIAIPCFLIGGIGYPAHFYIFKDRFSVQKQVIFQLCLTMIWVSYYLACTVLPGSPPKGYKSELTKDRKVWKRYCKKCESDKPERAHHCKTCRTCVLKMDHHCPWTMNCVGYKNMPHFLRFLFWVIVTTGITFVELGKDLIQYYKDRSLPSYLISKPKMALVIVLSLLNFMVLFSIIILFLREVYHIVFTGRTQIEGWECERIESQFYSERFWRRIKKNYKKVHGKKLPELTTWKNAEKTQYEMDYLQEDADHLDESERNILSRPKNSKTISDHQSIVPENFSFDDLVFPYDLSVYDNLVETLGPVYTWLLPWGGPTSDGLKFKRSDDAEDQLDLPWPPDGEDSYEPGDYELTKSYDEPQTEESNSGNFSTNVTNEVDDKDIDSDNDSVSSKVSDLFKGGKYFDNRLNLERTEWMNDFGENLEDFGVDIDTERTTHLRNRSQTRSTEN
ncbi:transferase activity protein [[Candida] boidinii]|uniref:Unnamed protein product n=1 Tax=Candida boidinii TaxID=5477 RepID=A0ACB5TZZ0_CANBO|nr:transferase activity protein [[Candida] boidinii]GME98184.1 unnamed protein product [[Candida] boidinii]